MALYHNATLCAICAGPVGTGAKVGFAPFVFNENDPLYTWSDSVVHRACLETHPSRELALRAKEALEGEGGVSGLPCVVCGHALGSMGSEWFVTWVLSSDPHSPLFEFNHVWLHKAHFPAWVSAARCQSVVDGVMRSEAWKGSTVVFDPLPSWTADASGTPVAIDWSRRLGPKH